MFAAILLAPKTTHAQTTISPGDLIKASSPAVYYYSDKGTRLVFPTEKTYFSWYADFDSVKTITDSELAAIPLGGNVTYKPGSWLVKITTDPKVYAVSTNGTLRHITTEQIASTLYGPDWNTKVHDIPDTFFVNYTIGSPINQANDFNIAEISALATSIDADKNSGSNQPDEPTTPETPTSTTATTTISLTLSKNTVYAGDSLTLSGQASDPEGIKQIRLYFDDNLVSSCDYIDSCVGDADVPNITDQPSYEARITVTNKKDEQFTKTAEVTVATENASTNVSLKIDQPMIRNNQTTGITLEVYDVAVYEMYIYIDESAKKVCDGGLYLCSYAQNFTGDIGTEFDVYGIVIDTKGKKYQTPTKTITIAENDSPVVSIDGGKNLIYTNETFQVTVQASDMDGISYLEILDQNKDVLHHCDGAAPCTYTTGPWLQNGNFTLYGKAEDLLGATTEQELHFTVTSPN